MPTFRYVGILGVSQLQSRLGPVSLESRDSNHEPAWRCSSGVLLELSEVTAAAGASDIYN